MNKQPLTILQLTDLHIFENADETLKGVNTESYWLQVFREAINQHPESELLVLTGDLTQKPCNAAYQRILQTLLSAERKVRCLPGNHDDYSLMLLNLNQGMVSCDKLTRLGNWLILTLNTQIIGEEGGALADQEMAFLHESLQQYPDCHVLIFCHHHLLASGSAWLDTMQVKNSAEFWRQIESYPQVRAISYGHIHQDFYARQGNIDVYGSPATCFQFKANSDVFAIEQLAPGYRWFRLYVDGGLQTGIERLDAAMCELDLSGEGY